MEHRALTNKDIKAYSALLLKATTSDDVAFAAYCQNGIVRADTNTACYASFPDHLQGNTDHCAVLYNGCNWPSLNWTDITLMPNSVTKPPKAYGMMARRWLTAVMDPKGAFKSILPFLYDDTVEKVITRRGFIFHNLCKGANLDLLFTFIGVARMASESPKTVQHYHYLTIGAKRLPSDIALWMAITMCPTEWVYKRNAQGYNTSIPSMTTQWQHFNFGHGAALGSSRETMPTYARRFLNADPKEGREDGEASMYQNQTVFAGDMAYRLAPRTIPEWAKVLSDLKTPTKVSNVKEEPLSAAA
jgi:hypothetical protein